MHTDIISLDKNSISRGEQMLQNTDIEKILSLRSCGWGFKRIAKELGISRRIIKKYIKYDGQKPSGKPRSKQLDGLESWLEDRYRRHRGNADVVRQELLAEHQIKVSLRTVERAVQHIRERDLVKAKATIRFETPPGKQLQIDFGSTKTRIAGEEIRIFLFVATLGYSRRFYVAPFLHERQNVWFRGIEGAFSHFGGMTEEILLDNARALVLSHDPASRTIIFNERFKAFTQYWGVKAIACAPYRARTKGKDERMVGYVKNNAIAGREFPNWDALVGHLEKWNAEIADVRIHGTHEEKPLERFMRDEMKALKPLILKPPFICFREVERVVHADACVELDTNYYTVPNKLVGKRVLVKIIDGKVRIYHNGIEVACHFLLEGRRERSVEAEHLKGIVGIPQDRTNQPQEVSKRKKHSELQRPLAEYELVVGGGW
jgi:transposase